jgi:TctA family transporter
MGFIHRSPVLTDGDITPFFTRPTCIVLWVITLASILMTIEPVRHALQQLVQKVRLGKRQRAD